MPKDPPPPVISLREVANQKSVSMQAVHAAAQRGTLTTYKSGGSVLVVRDAALDAYLAAPAQPNRKGS